MRQLKKGDIVRYIDNNGKKRELIYVGISGFVKAVKGEPECIQERFIDERGCVMHVPVNAWKFLTNGGG